MSLKHNLVASYFSQIYVTLIGILILPLYLKYLSPEAYGLVGFFSMLQSWFALLDLGLSPSVARETSRFLGGGLEVLAYRRLLRALQILFLAIAAIGGSVLLFFSKDIASAWLHVKLLSITEVKSSVQLMAVCVSIRWMSGLYRGVISGSELLVWLGGFNTIIATLRFIGVLPVLIFIKATPISFFLYQFGVAIFEMVGLMIKAYAIFPASPDGEKIGFSFASIRPIFKFSITIAFTSSVWILVTQTDKLVLSKLLSLTEFGYFTLAVLLASGVSMISGPISSVLLPRMARLQAENKEEELIQIYRLASQGVAVIAIPVSLMLAFFSKEVLWAWTGSYIVSTHASIALRLYALGNGILALSAFPYYLQFAKGDLRLHLFGNIIFVLVLIPALIFLTVKYGMTGAGYAWLGANLAYFFIWTPLVHNKFVKGLHWKWMISDLAGPMMVGSVSCTFLYIFAYKSASRLLCSMQLMTFGSLLLLFTCLSAKNIRKHFLMILYKKR